MNTFGLRNIQNMKFINPRIGYLLVITFLVCNACQSQEKTNPRVVRNFKAVSLAPDFDTTLVSQYIRSIFQDSKGNLWFGTIGEGVVRYDKQTLTYFSYPEGFINQTVFAINEDKQGNMWFGTDQGVYKYDPSVSLFGDKKVFRNYNQKDGLNHLDITRRGILVDNEGKVWVGTHAGVYRYDPTSESRGEKSFSLFSGLPKVNVAGIMQDKSGNIWFATSDSGVFRYDGKAITNFTEKELLGENYAGGIAEDKMGNIWFTMKNGICKYDPKAQNKPNAKVWTEITTKDGLGGNEFWGLYIEDSGIIWVTARGATTRFDPSLPLTDPAAFKVFTTKEGLNCCVQSMYQDQSGNMWWGTGQGLYRYDGKKFYQVKKNGPWR